MTTRASDDVVIRPATAVDGAAIGGLRRRWTEEDGSGREPDPGFEERFAEWLARVGSGRVVFVAEHGAGLIGMMNLAVFERMPKPGRSTSTWAYLSNAFVLEPWRDRGVGARLLAATVARARELGCVRVVLAPSERSVEFYRRAGFGPATMLMANVLSE